MVSSRKRLLGVSMVFLTLLLLISMLPVRHESIDVVANRLCRVDYLKTELAQLRTVTDRNINHYARSAALAIIAVEIYNRPAIWRLIEETLFAAIDWVSPHTSQITIGPAQISPDFFYREFAPLIPEAKFPASIITIEGAQFALQTWIAARLRADPRTSSSLLLESYVQALRNLVDVFYGSDNITNRSVTLYIAANLCARL